MIGVLFLPGTAIACDKVDYAEAKTWSTAKLQEAYCDTVTENYERLELQLNRVMADDPRRAAVCTDQQALYKRLLEARGKDTIKCAKK
jgi:hypothetical protein